MPLALQWEIVVLNREPITFVLYEPCITLSYIQSVLRYLKFLLGTSIIIYYIALFSLLVIWILHKNIRYWINFWISLVLFTSTAPDLLNLKQWILSIFIKLLLILDKMCWVTEIQVFLINYICMKFISKSLKEEKLKAFRTISAQTIKK